MMKAKHDLECDGEAPRSLVVDEGASKIEPVGDADAAGDECAFHHDQLASAMGL
jgi:hypothetical protein